MKPFITTVLYGPSSADDLSNFLEDYSGQTLVEKELLLLLPEDLPEELVSACDETLSTYSAHADFPVRTIRSDSFPGCFDQALEEAGGTYLHLIDLSRNVTFADSESYRTVWSLLSETPDAEAACFGCFTPESNKESNESSYKNLMANAFCGTGNGYALIKTSFAPLGEESQYTSYGNLLLNKFFQKDCCPSGGSLTDPILVADFILQFSAACDRVLMNPLGIVILPDPLRDEPSRYTVSSVDPEAFCREIELFLDDCEEIEPRITDCAAELCCDYELTLAADAGIRGWNHQANDLTLHITSVYPALFSPNRILERSIDSHVRASRLSSVNHDLRESRKKMWADLSAARAEKAQMWEDLSAARAEKQKMWEDLSAARAEKQKKRAKAACAL